MKKLLKIFLLLAAIFLVFMIILLGFLWWFGSSLISKKPYETVFKLPDLAAQISVEMKLNFQDKLIAALAEEKKKESYGKDETIELTEEEVNALIIYGLENQKKMLAEDERQLRDAYFKNGIFTVMLSKELGFGTPFGRYINITISFVPGIKDRHLYVLPKSFSMGKLGMPKAFVQGRMSSDCANIEQTLYGQMILDVVTEFTVEDGKVRIVYNPDKLFEFMMDKGIRKTGNLLGGGLGGMTLPAEE